MGRMLPLLLALAQGPKLPPPTVPDGWGVNIHFTQEAPGETAKIESPFRWVRMDFAWSNIEREIGKYDFSAYDRLVASLDRAKLRPYFILDYGNDLYQKGSPRSEESRTAFCRWVAAAMDHFKGRGIVWEMWNEPNIGFWQPKPAVEEYIALAAAVGQTIRRVAPKETFIGPATSGFDWAFLQRCLDAGLLKYWDAVSVHPYRQAEPETAVDDWLRLRGMLDRAAPGRNVPMISGEWGYSELYSGQTKERQGQFIARQYLVNLSCGVPLSIFYDWKDDGTDPKETEHHFGTVLPDLTPKPAYLAAEHLSKELAGFSYVTRLYDAPDKWVLLFRKGEEARLVAWTTGKEGWFKTPGKGPLVASRPAATWNISTDLIPLGPEPVVVRGASLAVLLNEKPLPWALTVESRKDLKPLQKEHPAADLVFPQTDEEGMFYEYRRLDGAEFELRTHLIARRPVSLTIYPGRQGGVFARFENPYRHDLKSAQLVTGDPIAQASPGEYPVAPDATHVLLWLDGEQTSIRVPKFVDLPLEGASATMDGDAKVRGNVNAETTPEGVRLSYDFEPGWRFAELHMAAPSINDGPKEIGMWVKGNGSGDLLRLRYTDATGQTFQPDLGPIDWKGWRYVSARLDGSGGRWGGANDGVVHAPIRITTLALVDMPGGRGGKGTITLARPVLVYRRK
jgi:hypothetical protein